MTINVKLEIESRLIPIIKGSFSLSAEAGSQSASLTIFADNIPTSPIYAYVKKGVKAKLLIDNEVVITGEIESRSASGDKDSYAIELSLKSTPEKGLKNSAKLRNGQALKTPLKTIIQEVADNAGIKVNLKGIKKNPTKAIYNCIGNLDTLTELQNLAINNGIHMHCDHNGELVFSEENEDDYGDDLIYGKHFIKFNAKEGEEKDSKEVNAVGQKAFGEIEREKTNPAIQKAVKKGNLDGVYEFYVDGDLDEQTLENVSTYLSNRVGGATTGIDIDFFTLSQPSGDPWRIKQKHYVQCPSENIYDDMILKSVSAEFSKDTCQVSCSFAPEKTFTNKKTSKPSQKGMIERSKVEGQSAGEDDKTDFDWKYE